MNVILMAKTQLTTQFFLDYMPPVPVEEWATDNEYIALTAVRNCYSHLNPSEILYSEHDRYFKDKENGSQRLFKQIASSKHTSTMEHIHFTFIVEDISRAALAQLTRHRHFGFSVKSQRYVKHGSKDKTGGFGYVTPKSIKDGIRQLEPFGKERTKDIYDDAMKQLQRAYDMLREAGVPAEDARNVLPNAATTHIIMSGNLRTILEFYGKRQKGRGAQAEIAELAETMRELVEESEPWTKDFFEVQ